MQKRERVDVEQGKRVLVVDDDAEVRRLLEGAFGQHGLVVDTAQDGRKAIALIAESTYSVVILDLVMPDGDGFHVLDHVRSRAVDHAPVVLVVTGASDRIVAELDPRLVHGIIRKPFDIQELTNIVVACAEIRNRSTFDKMAIAALFAGPPIMAWLSRLQ